MDRYSTTAPLDGMPKSKIKFLIRKYRLLYLKMMMQYSNFSISVNQIKPNRPFYEKVLIWIGKIMPLEKILDKEKCFYKLDEELKKVNDEDSEYYVSFLREYKFRSLMKKEVYAEGALYEFEGNLYNGPRDYNKYIWGLYDGT